MIQNLHSSFGADPAVRGSLEIRTACSSADWEIAHQMLDDEHFLGAGREAGDRLCQFVLEAGRIVAVLIWCAAAWHLKDRDTLIGWDPVTRSQRLKLVVQLRRFLVPDQARRPNLASQCLALGLREMPAQWLLLHGYRPLMAESFSDPESHAGTVYKATNWTYAGDTQGFSQDHTDYYLPNERPKKLWLKPLDPKATILMCAPHLPENCQAALTAGGGARSPLKVGQLKTLCHAYAAALTAWLQENSGILPRSLALDGKTIGDGKCGMIVTLCRHEDGRPVAMIPATGKKEDCEVSEARALLAAPQVRLENALITADSLHNKEATLRIIVEKGGDYLVGTKENTAKRLSAVETALEGTPFLP